MYSLSEKLIAKGLNYLMNSVESELVQHLTVRVIIRKYHFEFDLSCNSVRMCPVQLVYLSVT